MSPDAVPDPVDAILSAHGIRGAWTVLPTAGIANRTYATREVVLRVATDHPEAVADARTESVAAPAARAAGIRVPRLIAFDDSRALVDRPYSLWERIHAQTLSTCAPEPGRAPGTWRDLGRELCRLHAGVLACADPRGWLDDPSRGPDPEAQLHDLLLQRGIDNETHARLVRWLVHLRPSLADPLPRRFVHNDAHAGNLLCTRGDRLAALIDWGDAGWGDPAIELASVPLEAVPLVVAGYEDEGGHLGGDADARILFDQLAAVGDASILGQTRAERITALMTFARSAPARWRRLPG
jgi:aminoglycoside phosphotransferase (APT) family kinase protein